MPDHPLQPSSLLPIEDLGVRESVIILSDLHLGRGDANTGFGGGAKEVARALQALAQEAELVIVNGDLYDLDRGSFPTAQRREYQFLQPRWRPVEKALKQAGARVTSGNHDHALRGQDLGGGAVAGAFRLRVGGLRLHIEHGERFNAWIKQHRALTSFVTWMSGVASRSVWGRPLYRLLRGVEACTTDDQEDGVVRRAETWLRDEPNIDLMVIGHTHQYLHQKVGEALLLNPGDSMAFPLVFLKIDGVSRSVQNGSVDAEGRVVINQSLALFRGMGNASPPWRP